MMSRPGMVMYTALALLWVVACNGGDDADTASAATSGTQCLDDCDAAQTRCQAECPDDVCRSDCAAPKSSCRLHCDAASAGASGSEDKPSSGPNTAVSRAGDDQTASADDAG